MLLLFHTLSFEATHRIFLMIEDPKWIQSGMFCIFLHISAWLEVECSLGTSPVQCPGFSALPGLPYPWSAVSKKRWDKSSSTRRARARLCLEKSVYVIVVRKVIIHQWIPGYCHQTNPYICWPITSKYCCSGVPFSFLLSSQ